MDHPSKVLVQQGFETQGWQLTSDNQRKQILKNFKSKLKTKKLLRTFVLAVMNASCMRDLAASVSSKLHCNRSRKSGRDTRHLHESHFINHHLVVFKHIGNDRIIQLGRHGWCLNPLLESV